MVATSTPRIISWMQLQINCTAFLSIDRHSSLYIATALVHPGELSHAYWWSFRSSGAFTLACAQLNYSILFLICRVIMGCTACFSCLYKHGIFLVPSHPSMLHFPYSAHTKTCTSKNIISVSSSHSASKSLTCSSLLYQDGDQIVING